ncbi:MAG: TolC family protein [Bacteroidota bacterium]
MLAKSISIVCCICLLHPNITDAQTSMQPDTLRMDVKQAEKLFLDKNLSLLAGYYNIQSSKALVEQARKWDNPMLNTDQNLYRDGKFFQHTTTHDSAGNSIPVGEFYVQIQQLIKTAGKRRKQVDLAKTNVSISEWQFKSTMRSLRAELLKDLYTVAQLQGNAKLYAQSQEQLNKLLHAMEAQFNAGNVAKKEYLRIQALLVSLQQDMTDNEKELDDTQAELKSLLQISGNTFIQPLLPDHENATIPDVSITKLLDSAKRNNTDYQLEVYQLQYQTENVRLQKALAVPDLTLGPEFDQNANYAPNYFGLAISLPLPLLDRNQGNIKSAKFLTKAEEANMQEAEIKLKNDVLNAYQKLRTTIMLSNGQSKDFYKEYYQLYSNIVESYNKRQISLLEFLDYFNDYEDIRQKELQQTLNLRMAKEELNDIVGIDVIID